MLDCILAISGEPSPDDMRTCMDPDDRRTPAAAKQLNRIGESAKHVFANTGAFPRGKVELTPGKECCTASMETKAAVKDSAKCPVDAAAWQDPMWKALGLSIDEPSLYRYSYESDARNSAGEACALRYAFTIVPDALGIRPRS